MLWQLTALANAVILAAYMAISFAIARGLWQSRQWRNNPLGLATASIFFSCAVHHGSHTAHLLAPYLGMDAHIGLAMRHAFGQSLHIAGWDVITAALAVWYWTLRGRFPALVRGAAVFEDLRLRQAAEATLRASEERYRGIVETTSEGVALLDDDGRIAYANARFAAMVGRDGGGGGPAGAGPDPRGRPPGLGREVTRIATAVLCWPAAAHPPVRGRTPPPRPAPWCARRWPSPPGTTMVTGPPACSRWSPT